MVLCTCMYTVRSAWDLVGHISNWANQKKTVSHSGWPHFSAELWCLG